MRTSIILDDELAIRLRAEANRCGKSLSRFLADAGREVLRLQVADEPEPFGLLTVGGDGPQPGVNLDASNDLIAADDITAYGR